MRAFEGLVAAGLLGLALVGCSQDVGQMVEEDAAAAQAAKQPTGGHEHGAWWCDAHGVPEEVCGQCSAKLAAKFQKDGDWCEDHERPDSQCFKCHPELEGKFAAQYEAKYGKQPPKPES